MRSEGYCSWVVCVSVCPLVNISPLERLFNLKTLAHTQRATKVKIFVGFSLKPLRCKDPALTALHGYVRSRPFFLRGKRACALTTPRSHALSAVLLARACARHLREPAQEATMHIAARQRFDSTTALWNNK